MTKLNQKFFQDENEDTLEIYSGNPYPSNELSNFYPHKFTVTWKGFTVECESIEGFLQSLTYESPEKQKQICSLTGLTAKHKENTSWKKTQTLWWNGEPIKRKSFDYQNLLDEAYMSMCMQSESFRKALKASGNAKLTHSLGEKEEKKTILTEFEFCSRLMNLRKAL
jgi:hypothetical protein